jgi:hypothetical protein
MRYTHRLPGAATRHQETRHGEDFVVNGQLRTVTTDPERPLLEVLREDLQLTVPNMAAARAGKPALSLSMAAVCMRVTSVNNGPADSDDRRLGDRRQAASGPKALVENAAVRLLRRAWWSPWRAC